MRRILFIPLGLLEGASSSLFCRSEDRFSALFESVRLAQSCVAEEQLPARSSVPINVSKLTCHELNLLTSMNGERFAEIIATDRITNRSLEYVKGLTLAHSHIIVSLFSRRYDCVSESLRLAVMVFLRNIKNLFVSDQYSSFFDRIKDSSASIVKALSSALSQLPPDETKAYYTHENDGRLTTLESLRIFTFDEDRSSVVNNLCLLQFAISSIFTLNDTVLDIGSGPSGVHSEWFNKTGLVTAFAIDGSPSVGSVSGGIVSEIDARNRAMMSAYLNAIQTSIDWVWCINVLNSVTQEAASSIIETMFTAVKPKKGIVLVSNPFPQNLAVQLDSSTYHSRNDLNVCNRTDIKILISD